MPRRVLLPPLLILVSCCVLLAPDGRCGPESRELILVLAPTPLIAYGQLVVVERDAPPARTLSWYFESGQLRGRIEHAALVERSTGRLVMSLPVTVGPDSITLHDSAIPYSGTLAFDRFFDLARSEAIVMALDTGRAASPRVELVLTLYEYKPWRQPYCS